MDLLELRGVTKRVAGEVHIHPTDLSLEPGTFNILLGTTLSGKTTLMQLMAGLERPTGGTLHFRGQDVTRTAVQKRNVSMVYQQFINYPGMTVFQNIASPLRVAGVDPAEIKRRVGAMAELMRISGFLDRRPSELSGGQQQRTAMARALVKDSDLILLDEPLANLDFKLREELRDELPRLFGQRDVIVVYATTEPTEALLFGGQTAALHEGSVVDFGATAAIYRRPRSLLAAQVFSEPPINVAPVVKSGRRITLNPDLHWSIEDTFQDGPYTVGLRPHLISPLHERADQVAVAARVKVAELSGSESMIHFDAFGHSWVSLSHGVHPFDVGQEATFYADFGQAFYFAPDGKLVHGPGD